MVNPWDRNYNSSLSESLWLELLIELDPFFFIPYSWVAPFFPLQQRPVPGWSKSTTATVLCPRGHCRRRCMFQSTRPRRRVAVGSANSGKSRRKVASLRAVSAFFLFSSQPLRSFPPLPARPLFCAGLRGNRKTRSHRKCGENRSKYRTKALRNSKHDIPWNRNKSGIITDSSTWRSFRIFFYDLVLV